MTQYLYKKHSYFGMLTCSICTFLTKWQKKLQITGLCPDRKFYYINEVNFVCLISSITCA